MKKILILTILALTAGSTFAAEVKTDVNVKAGDNTAKISVQAKVN
jgi:hypothetical protein